MARKRYSWEPPPPELFKVGDVVEWTSSAAGYTKTKRGMVVAIVPAGARRARIEERYRETHPRYRRKTDGGGLPRDHESYLVLVPAPTSKAMPQLYWPIVAKLEKVIDVPRLEKMDE